MVMAMFVACDSGSRSNDDDDDDDEETKKKKTDKVETTAEPNDTTEDPFYTTESFDHSVNIPDLDDPTDFTTDITGNVPSGPDNNQYEITYLQNMSEGLVLFQTNERKYGFMDLQGNVVIEPEFEWADVFSNGRANIAEEVDGKFRYGYIDRTGKVVIDCIYDYNESFESNIVRLEKDRVSMFVDLNGNVIYTVTGNEEEVSKIYNGWFWVETVKSTLAGNTHYMTYYNQNGKAFTIENASHYNYFGSSQSYMNEWGYAVISLLNGEDEPQNVIIDSTGNQPEWIYGLVEENTYISVVDMDGNYARIKTPDPESGNDTLSYTAYLDFETQTAKIATYSNIIHHELGNGYWYMNSADSISIMKKEEIFLDLGAIEAFKPAEINDVEYAYIDGKDYFIVHLTNSGGTGFQAVIDGEGNVVIEPTNEYTFEVPYHGANFLLICTYKNYERLYGFIDIEGNILTAPTYKDTSINDICTYNGVTSIIINYGTTLVDLNGNVIFEVETAS